jgi:hypothetical protein
VLRRGRHVKNSPENDRRRLRFVAVLLFLLGVLALVGSGVYAGLLATATGTETVSSGTLSLTVAAGSGSGGFGQTVSNMAPGDIFNVYVDLTSAGTIAGSGITLGVTGTGSNELTTSATDGLQVAINQCSVAWTVSTGVCSGTTNALVASTAVANLSSAAVSMVSGTVSSGSLYHLQVSLLLPNQTETVVNGVQPSPTIEGLSTVLTYTFTEAQRTAITTNA